MAEIDKITQDYTEHLSDDKIKQVQAWVAERDKLVKSGFRPAIDYLKNQTFNDAEDTILGVAVKKFAAVQKDLDAIIADELSSAERTDKEAEHRYDLTSSIEWISVAFGVGLCGVMAFYVRRSIMKPLSAMTSAMNALAGGDLAITIPSSGRNDEIGGIAKALEVFKETAIKANELAKATALENEGKELRRRKIEQYIAKFQDDITQAMSSLATTSAEMRSTAEKLSATM